MIVPAKRLAWLLGSVALALAPSANAGPPSPGVGLPLPTETTPTSPDMPPPEGLADRPGDWWDRLQNDIALAKGDFAHFYSWPNLGGVALGVAAAAPIANSYADRS